MLKFTNSKALTLSAMLMLGTATVFGQSTTTNSYWGKPADAKFPILYSTDASQPADYLDFPGNSVEKSKGVYFRFSDKSSEGTFYYPVLSKEKPDGNKEETVIWHSKDSLGIFLGDNQKGEVLFNLSTKYLKDVKNFSIKLTSDKLGKVPTSTSEWKLKITVFDLSGNKAKKSDILKGYSDSDDAVFESDGSIFSTKDDASKIINLFREVKDPITDENQFIESSLSNRYIQIELFSEYVPIMDVENSTKISKSHFAPALIISDFNMGFAEPGISLTADNDYLEAGKGFTSCEEGSLVLKLGNMIIPKDSKVSDVLKVTSPTNDVIAEDFSSNIFKQYKEYNDSLIVSDNYNFQPKSIFANKEGQFAVELENSPICMDASARITSNSKPELYYGADHIYFGKSIETKVIAIWGKNIPKVSDESTQGLSFVATERETTDQSTEYGNVIITNNFVVSECGIIEKKSTNYLSVQLKQSIDDVTRPEVWWLGVNGTDYSVSEALPYYPTIEGVAGVGAMWLTFEGKNFDNTKSRYEADNVFFAPYKEKDNLSGKRTESREKTYMLHLSDIRPTNEATGEAVITVWMGKQDNDNNNSDNQEFRFRLPEKGSTWTNANTDKLTFTINTLDEELMKTYLEKGYPIDVQFIPNQDGFKNPVPSEKTGITWEPDLYVLHVSTPQRTSTGDDTYVTAVAAGLMGDTRANLWSNMNKLNDVIQMHNSWVNPFNESLKYPEFRKNFGKKYLNSECSANNPYAVDSFYIAGYNLEKKVTIERKNTNKSDYKNAFSFKVIDKITGKELIGDKVELNKETDSDRSQYGEVWATVIVTFNPTQKIRGQHMAEDLFTISTDENVVVEMELKTNTDIDSENLGTIENPEFSYKKYQSIDKGAEVFGFIYEPYVTIQSTKEGQVVDNDKFFAKVNEKDAHTVIITGEEFTALQNVAVSLTEEGSPYSLNISSPKTDLYGHFEATGTLTYKPETKNLCSLSDKLEVVTSCTKDFVSLIGTPYWNGVSPELVPMNYMDIDGKTTVLKWKRVPGAQYYKVKVGHISSVNTSENVFISEVRASGGDQTLAVELYNGTGRVINPSIMVNYYLKVWRKDLSNGGVIDSFYGHFTNTDLNLIEEANAWRNKALIVNEFVNELSYDAVKKGEATPVDIVINDNYEYKIKLMEGRHSIDAFEFGQAGAHLARTSVSHLPMNRGEFDLSAWETKNTSLKNKDGLAYYKWQDQDNFILNTAGDGAESYAIPEKDNLNKEGNVEVSIYNLKPSTTYDVMVTAYNDCMPLATEEGEAMSDAPTLLKGFIDTSIASGEVHPEGDVTFEYEGSVTGNDPISANAFKVVSGKSSVTIYNAAGKKAVVRNILGQPIAETVISSDNATIAAPAGIITVAVEGETTVKAIVK